MGDAVCLPVLEWLVGHVIDAFAPAFFQSDTAQTEDQGGVQYEAKQHSTRRNKTNSSPMIVNAAE
jgi:hypothetical protein